MALGDWFMLVWLGLYLAVRAYAWRDLAAPEDGKQVVRSMPNPDRREQNAAGVGELARMGKSP